MGFLEEIDDTCKLVIDTNSKHIHYTKGELIFQDKEPLDHLYIIVKGYVTTYSLNNQGRERVIFTLQAGSILNDCTFEAMNATCNAVAFSTCDIMCIPFSTISTLMIEPHFAKQLVIELSKINRRLTRQIKSSSASHIDKKIAAKIWKLSIEFGKESGEWHNIDMTFPVTYLAKMIGTNRETVSRTLSMFETLDILKWQNKQLYIKQNEMLAYYRK